MKNLDKLYKEALADVRLAGIVPGNIVCVRPNSRSKRYWGWCKRRNGVYIIEISTKLLEDSVPDVSTKNTIVHEILHSAKDGMGHKGAWKQYADIINAKYPHYHISRTNSAESLGVRPDAPEDHRYNVICQSCGHIYNYDRWCKVLQNPSHYHCGSCGGTLKTKCNVEGMTFYSAANRA